MLYSHTNHTDIDPLAVTRPSATELQQAAQHMIISASGWRKVFARTEEGWEKDLLPSDAFLSAFAAIAFYEVLQPKTVLIGTDTRPTGAAIADIISRLLLSLGAEIIPLSVCAAPEIMALSSAMPDSSFFYITASHNPIGHNGFKMGKQGGVVTKERASEIALYFSQLLEDPTSAQKAADLSSSVDPKSYFELLSTIAKNKEKSLLAYERLLMETTFGSNKETWGSELAHMRTEVQKHPIGIVGELNGSARSQSIDQQFLKALGLKTLFVNTQAHQIVHPIIPEGANLELCCQILDDTHYHDPSFVLGYVPDNDGDRGNIVYWDPSLGKSRALEAQNLFALIAAIEMALYPQAPKKAIVVNGPTSLMIDELARRWGFSVFRSEVGEANVVQLAEQKRQQGYAVPLLGEGSNGGTISHPAKVRDPLNMILTLVKLLGSQHRYTHITGLTTSPSIADALQTLPKRRVTGTTEPLAMMILSSVDYGELKKRYERLFIASWEQRKAVLLNQFGIDDYRCEQTEGTLCRHGIGEAFRTAPYTGGLKMVFLNQKGEDTDFLWLRPSGTEALLRVAVDAKGENPLRYTYLLNWQRELLQKASSVQ
ncbi:MAG: phosphoglucomutase [Sphaerochaetaceae bacterium]